MILRIGDCIGCGKEAMKIFSRYHWSSVAVCENPTGCKAMNPMTSDGADDVVKGPVDNICLACTVLQMFVDLPMLAL